MPIQWFPGHMNSTKKAIAERLPEIDVVIELLDARLPGSSANPLLADLTRGKPALKVLNKQDLADPARTALWLAHYQARPGTNAIGLDASVTAPARQLIAACRELAPLRGGMVKPVRVLICGIPNVGKSTLINTLLGQRSAKTGDEPGITKVEQRLTLASDFYLYDTPGMLWPRITVEQSGYHLAASGGIGRNAYDEEEVALDLLARVRPHYADRLQARYKLADLAGLSDEALLADIGRKRGGLMAGGKVNLQKAAEVVITDFRTGTWGRITLETPDEFMQWQAAGQVLDAQRQARRDARNQKKIPQRDAAAAAAAAAMSTDAADAQPD
ncbi:GTP-binding protein HSR1-related [Leptothrix cholodnii SP-6]|uniref:Ribosome biogenesis GTPase A n=1 Tax=Leptothrix cholodnii (strain ATCC 51168 / LMG 8142 / SP-6) TaxID=395495 RepID=B1Y5P0_LEPCP|nr:ribosome biogenesis GTPase YlqF [Leptothrix cholodnii]ACB34752.1 GTP-binding protein HSR1-related [Leptothrix cholodnii SP-6]